MRLSCCGRGVQSPKHISFLTSFFAVELGEHHQYLGEKQVFAASVDDHHSRHRDKRLNPNDVEGGAKDTENNLDLREVPFNLLEKTPILLHWNNSMWSRENDKAKLSP